MIHLLCSLSNIKTAPVPLLPPVPPCHSLHLATLIMDRPTMITDRPIPTEQSDWLVFVIGWRSTDPVNSVGFKTVSVQDVGHLCALDGCSLSVIKSHYHLATRHNSLGEECIQEIGIFLNCVSYESTYTSDALLPDSALDGLLGLRSPHGPAQSSVYHGQQMIAAL